MSEINDLERDATDCSSAKCLPMARQSLLAKAMREERHPPMQSETGGEAEPDHSPKISVFQQFEDIFGTDDREPQESTH